jgi:hypothetical protein
MGPGLVLVGRCPDPVVDSYPAGSCGPGDLFTVDDTSLYGASFAWSGSGDAWTRIGDPAPEIAGGP